MRSDVGGRSGSVMNRLIVIGASSGGVDALLELTAALPADLPAAVLIVLHIGTHRSLMPELIARRCPLDVAHAQDGEEVIPGLLRVAPSDRHLLVEGTRLRLSRGPKEHHARPAIDPLFRSAALACGTKVIGVVLTGYLDDGTPGLQAIKAAGGIAVVQDPETAWAPSMPTSALRHVAVDHCVGLESMPELLCRLAASPPDSTPDPDPSPDHLAGLRHEVDLTLKRGDPMEHLGQIATPSPFTCPDCHGGLWEVRDSHPARFRCHTGHGFTLRSLQETMGTVADESGWNALRAIQERKAVLEEMLERAGQEDAPDLERLRAAVDALARQAERLRLLLEQGPDPVE